MAVYTLKFYDINPTGFLGNAGSTGTYRGPDTAAGIATVTDSQRGADGTGLDDDDRGENARANISLGRYSSSNSPVDAEIVWTVRDTVTNQTFQVVQFDVESGSARGYYTLSEKPLVSGRSYEVISRHDNPDMGSNGADGFSYADYQDGLIEGTSGDDVINSTTTPDPQGELVDEQYRVENVFSWEQLDRDGRSVENGASTTVGGVRVSVGYSETARDNTATISNDRIYTENGDFDSDSSLRLFGTGARGETSKLTLDFSSSNGATAQNVENVSFRISDIDTYNFTDRVTVTTYDADGNAVTLTITSEGAVRVNGNTATATYNANYVEGDDANGAILVTIPGPVSSVEISYSNAGSPAQQAIYVSDVKFETVYTDADDVIDAGAGNDVIDSGLGNDTVHAGAGNDTVRAGPGNDTVYGGTGNDVIDGGAGNDTLHGEDGNDTLIGGAGNDTMTGGNGDDTFIGGAGADSMDGGTGQDTIDYSASGAGVSVNLATGSFSGGDAEGDSGTGIDGIIGSAYDDTLIGFDGQSTSGADAYTNIFHGGAGNDYLDGAGGDDELYGDEGDDTILGGAGNDLIDGGDGNDTIHGGTGADRIFGGAGDDTIYAGGGDTITGGAGNDRIIIDPGLLDGRTITIIGSEIDDDEQGDVLDLSRLGSNFIRGSISYDETNRENGSLTLADGTVINFSNIETVICFARGTRIATPQGARRVEDLRVGDPVVTMDNGIQRLRWIGAREVPAVGRFAPVEIAAGALGNEAALTVSPQHRMLLRGWRADMLFGTSEVFAAARHLVNGRTIRQRPGGTVCYYHLMFDRHEVIFAEGAASESFHVSDYSLTGVADRAREELFALFPELRSLPGSHGDTARRCLKSHEAELLIA
ncbi:Hint domain-containing protein [Celeribacter indicus]|uniref:Hedgehog/Intein (Hint) domain-containing protein n=1 Tax=Celeribacter indicus TaxID=1208324 RepID=A0A0B5E3A3_9RHOB|nr:Hint domain-containing protein [Celeribacter indicus]AJE47875.1 hypothetical protein P73_3160 [Celeribacter indicus]SDW25645.1 Ca2+-binding protein, RTX toxin-related [Celeribacter indicus]